MTKEERLVEATREHKHKVLELTKEENAKFSLLKDLIGLTSTEVTIVSQTQISISTSRNDAFKTISDLKDRLFPISIKNGKYTTYSDKNKDSSYIEIFPVTVDISKYGTSLRYYIVHGVKKITVIHKIDDADSFVSSTEVCVPEACDTVVESCNLVSSIDSSIQKYGTHKTGLFRYTLFWEYNYFSKDFEEMLNNAFKNAMTVV